MKCIIRTATFIVAAQIVFAFTTREAGAVQLTLNLVQADSHIAISGTFGGNPFLSQEGVAGTTDGNLALPSTETTFQGPITVDVDNLLAPTSIRILSSSAAADSSGIWMPKVRPYQDLNGDGDPGDFGLPPDGDSEVGTNNNFGPAADADWSTRVFLAAFGANIAYGGYRDISYNLTSGVESVVLGQFSSLSQHVEPDGFLDYWVAPGAGGLLGRTEANTGDGNFYGNTAAASTYTVTPLGGGASKITLVIPVLVDDHGDTLRTTYIGQFVATAIVPEPSSLLMLALGGIFAALTRARIGR